MQEERTVLTIEPGFRDLTVGEYLGILWPDRSRRVINELFAHGRIRSAGQPIGPRQRLESVEELVLVGSLRELPSIPYPRTDPLADVDILHEDDRLVVLAKPSSLAVVPDRTQGDQSCLGLLIRRELDGRASKPPADYLRYRIVHRLDRFTSGVLIVAKLPEAERQLSRYFEKGQVEKEYLALVDGTVAAARLTVNCPVVSGRKGKMRAEAKDNAAPALTDFEVVERFEGVSLIRARPRTGRTHQIRVHAWATGHPLAIDPLYGRKEPTCLPEGIARLTLHAHQYTLPPKWGEPRSFTCPLPKDFDTVLRGLRKEKEVRNAECGMRNGRPPASG